MGCSAFTLSVATLSGVAGLALIAIAFATDNWAEVRVNRENIRQKLSTQPDKNIAEQLEKDRSFYSRDVGLFRECFPSQRPKNIEVYISPTETHCINVDYHIPEDKESAQFNEDMKARLHMARACVALIICSFFFIGVAFFVGVVGCWMRSPSKVVTTGIFMLLSALFCAGGIGLWHGKEYYERFKITGAYFNSWPLVLRNNVDFFYGWSYIICWIGVGWCLISAIVFFCAAKCLRDERKPESSKSMQYLMPVYPNKQQPFGYGYGYPGPYYHHGSQYGPYSY
ncbi:hypothetical protein CHUAL_003400 [Chamberlinius hualienensis]